MAQPTTAEDLTGLAIALAEEGRIAEAIDADRAALARRPDDETALSHLAELKRFTAGDPDLAALEEVARANPSPRVLFALGKALEDIGDYAQAFEVWRKANALKRDGMTYDVEVEIRLLNEIAQVFNPALFETRQGAGSPSEVPILIVGMPRSGTTLVEQILASHPAVRAAGERTQLKQSAGAVGLLSEAGVGFPGGIQTVSPDHLKRLGAAYAEGLHNVDPAALRVTDKEPFNFRYLGLARLIVPRAHVIHCTRHPLDTCLSCFSANFQGVEFSYDLDELARYYLAYRRLMDHWARVLPAGWVLDVQYERLVDDLEGHVRRLLEHCELPWDASCLEFHRTRRSVQTASFAQVRRPLYRDSLARWQRYEEQLAPLRGTLEPAGVAETP